METITREKLQALASMVRDLKCSCGLNFKESLKEPCMCQWVPIEEWFEDFDIGLEE